jgi:hypothetical protein
VDDEYCVVDGPTSQCLPTCVMQAEICDNNLDDNCNGLVDEPESCYFVCSTAADCPTFGDMVSRCQPAAGSSYKGGGGLLFPSCYWVPACPMENCVAAWGEAPECVFGSCAADGGCDYDYEELNGAPCGDRTVPRICMYGACQLVDPPVMEVSLSVNQPPHILTRGPNQVLFRFTVRNVGGEDLRFDYFRPTLEIRWLAGAAPFETTIPCRLLDQVYQRLAADDADDNERMNLTPESLFINEGGQATFAIACDFLWDFPDFISMRVGFASVLDDIQAFGGRSGEFAAIQSAQWSIWGNTLIP